MLLLQLCPLLLISQGYDIEHLLVEVDVHQNGLLQVQEHYALNFVEKKRGIIRHIPSRHLANGEDKRVRIKAIKTPGWNHHISREGGHTIIRIGDQDVYHQGQKDITIMYDVEGATMEHDAYDEIYWNLVGTEWDVPIEQMEFKIALESLSSLPTSHYEAYSGKQGAGVLIPMDFDQGYLTGRVTDLAKGEGVTVAVALPQDYFTIPSRTARFWKANKEAPLALVTWLGLIWFWGRRKVNRSTPDADPNPALLTGVSPMLAGRVIERNLKTRHLLSMLPYWANRGHIEMYGPQGAFSADQFCIEKKNGLKRTDRSQHLLFDALFSGGSLVSITSLRNKLFPSIGPIGKALRKELNEMGIYDRSPDYKQRKRLMAMVAAIAGFLAIVCFVQLKIMTGIILVILLITSLIMCLAGPGLSNVGVGLFEQIDAYRLFISDPDPEALQSQLLNDPRYLEKSLPYAIAFGIDESFFPVMTQYQDRAPSWYQHATTTATVNAVPTINEFVQQFRPKEMVTAFEPVAQPSTSSGSVTGSQGSVGGGYGGGGGSSW